MSYNIKPMKRHPKEFPIQLIWGRTKDNWITLRAVTTSPTKAKMYKEMILRDDKEIVDVKIEPSRANHLYGTSIVRIKS